MTLPRLVAAFAAFAFASAAVAGDPPKIDAYGLPLPTGAKTRLGNTTLVFRYAPSFAPLPPDYKFIGIADSADVLRRVEIGSNKPPERPSGIPGGGGQLIVSGDGKHYIVFRTGIVTIRSTATGKPETQIKRTEGFSTTFVSGQASAALSADGKVFVQGGQDKEGKGDVTVWDVEKNEVLFHTGIAGRGAALPVLSADGKLLATRGIGGYPGPPPAKADEELRHTIQVWDIAEKKELFQAKVTAGGAYQITATAFSPDGSLLAASMGDGLIDWWDVKTGKPRTPLLGRSGQGYRVAFSPDGKTLASAGTDGTVERWAAADGKLIGTTEAPEGIPAFSGQNLVFAGNDRVLVWGAVGAAAVVWEAPSGKALTPIPEHTSSLRSIAFTADGKQVLTSGNDGRVVRWDAATGKPLGPVEVKLNRAATTQTKPVLTLSNDATRGVSTGSATVYSLKTGLEEFTLPRAAPTGFASSTVLSPDLKTAVVVSIPYDQKRNGSCMVWDLTERRKLGEIEFASSLGFAPAVAVSPSGKRLVTAAYPPRPGMPPLGNGKATLVVTGWDLATGKKLGEVEDLEARGQAYVAAVSDSYALVASGSGRLRAYDFETGKGGDEFEAAKERGDVTAGPVVFAPGGKLFASGVPGTDSGTYGVKVYEWPTGNVLHTFVGHAGPVTAIAFSADGKTLATGSQDTTVVLWNFENDAPRK